MRLFLLTFLCIFSAAAQPQLFVLPGSTGQTTSVNPYTINPFLQYPTFEAQGGAAFFFVHPDASKFYTIARSAGNTLRVVNAAPPFNLLKNQSLVQAEAAALTPNGQRLLILGTSLSIFETAADTLVATLSTPNPIDIAVSRDSSRAFVLSAGQVTAINLTTNTALPNPLSISGGISISTGLNGLVYVTAANRIYEINPANLSIRKELPVNGRPGRLAFTPDGLHALAVNETPVTGASLFRIALPGFTLSATFPNFQATLSSLVVTGNNRVYALAAQQQALYEVAVDPLLITNPLFGNIGTPDRVLGVAASLETPIPRYLFVLTANTLYRLDNTVSPPNGTAGGELMPSPDPGPMFFRAASVTGTPAALLAYNTAQSTSLDSLFQPLIARVTDSNGRPLRNVAVNFSSNLPTAPVSVATVFTDNEGFAQTTVPTPGTLTSFQVTAQAGSAPAATYQLSTVGSVPGSGNTLTIVRGQGQIVQEQFQIREPLTVVLRNSAGAPLAGQAVTFSIVSGSGTFNTSTSDGTLLTGVVCSGSTCTGTTDAEGRTAIGFIATGVPIGNSYSQQTIAASANGQTVNFLLTTVLGQLLGGGSASPPLVERLAPAGNLLTGAAGSTIADAIRVRVVVVSGPQSGQAIPNVSLRAFTGNTPGNGPTAQCAGPDGVALTGGDGIATCNLVLGPTTGLAPLSVNIGGFTSLGGASVNIDVRGGPPLINGSFPLAGQGTASNFSFSVSHPDGLNRLGVINLLINSSLNGGQACYLAYSVPLRVLYLVNDAGPDAGLSAPLALGAGTSGFVANSQCQINAAFSSALTSGNSITLSLNTQFKSAFTGGKVLYVAARTTDGLNTGWRTAGVYDVPVATPSFPNSSTANPSAGTATNALLSFTYRDQSSQTNLQTVWGLMNTALDGAGGCYFGFHAPTNQLFLVPDNGNGAQAQSIPLPGSGSIENSQCRINAFGSVVNRSGDTLNLSLNMTFKAGFSGPKVIWTAASTLTNVVSQWRAAGAWLLP